MTDQQRTRLMNLAQRLVQLDPIDSEDQVEREASLRYTLHALKSAAFDVNYVINQAEAYLEQRELRWQMMPPEQRDEVLRWRKLREAREQRDSWQKQTPRVISREEHDALFEGPAQRAVSKEEYERMMKEQQG